MIHPADRAANLVERHIRAHREPLTHMLASLEPLEALCLLGELVSVTINRFSPNDRTELLVQFCDELTSTPDA